MTAPNFAYNLSARVAAGAGTISVGHVLIPQSSGGEYVIATSANRGTRRSHGISLTALSGRGTVQLQSHGTISAAVSGLATAVTVQYVRVSSAGVLERCGTTPSASDDVCGVAELDGTVHLWFGAGSGSWGSGGGANPAGSNGDLQIKNGTALAALTGTAGQVARHNGTTWAASDDVIELPSGLAAGDLLYVDEDDELVRIPIGTTGQVLTVVGGVPAWADPTGGGGGDPGFDPATLALTTWVRASYSGDPWTQEASGGTSGSNAALTEGGTAPSTGSAVNGHTPADFDGTDDLLTGDFHATLFNATAYSVIQLVWIDAFTVTDPGAAAPYGCPGAIGNSTGDGGPVGGFAGSGGTGVFRYGHSDVVDFDSASVAVSTGEWVMVAACFDGNDVKVSKNAGTASTKAIGSVSALTGASKLGPNFSSAQFFDGKILEVMTADIDLSASLADIKAYFETRYGITLT